MFKLWCELGISLSFLTKIVSTARRNRRLSTKPVAGIAMLSTLVKPKEDYKTNCKADRTAKNDKFIISSRLVSLSNGFIVYFSLLILI